MGRIDHSRPYILILKEDKGLRGSPCTLCALGWEKQDWNCWEGCQAAAKRIGADPWYSYYIVHYLDYPGDTEPEMERRMVCGDTEQSIDNKETNKKLKQHGKEISVAILH